MHATESSRGTDRESKPKGARQVRAPQPTPYTNNRYSELVSVTLCSSDPSTRPRDCTRVCDQDADVLDVGAGRPGCVLCWSDGTLINDQRRICFVGLMQPGGSVRVDVRLQDSPRIRRGSDHPCVFGVIIAGCPGSVGVLCSSLCAVGWGSVSG